MICIISFHVEAFPTDFIRLEKGLQCSKRAISVTKTFQLDSESNESAIIARTKCEVYCSRQQTCWGCSVDCESVCKWNAIGDCGDLERWQGMIDGDVTQKPGKIRIISYLQFKRCSIIPAEPYNFFAIINTLCCSLYRHKVERCRYSNELDYRFLCE